MSTNRPDKNWSLDRLGGFCARSQKRLAVEAWRFGHALNLARDKQPHGEWRKWKKKYVPGLSHSSEHRYRTLAERLPESSLDGIGLTEVYRLLGLTYTKTKEQDDPFPQATSGAVLSGPGAEPPVALSSSGSPAHEATDDRAMSPPTRFHKLPPATGLMEIEAPPAPPQVTTGLMECEPKYAAPLVVPFPVEEQYKLYFADARNHMEALQSWTDWLHRQGEGFRFEMWDKHGVGGMKQQIETTIESLRWVADNLEW